MRTSGASDEFLKMVGDRIRARRRELGLTQMQLAETLECDLSTYLRYEHGEINFPLSKLRRLGLALRCDPQTFLAEPTDRQFFRDPPDWNPPKT